MKLYKYIAFGALLAVALPALAQTYPYYGATTAGYGYTSASATVAYPYPGNSCPSLSYNLYVGLSDRYTLGQVSQLQQFLAQRYGNQAVTGYFGFQTRGNVVRFQQEQGIYPITGGVGPLTRAAISRVCGGVVVPPQPTGGVSITGVSGPNSLAMGQTGTWSITTNAPQGSYLSTSVRWGDENLYGYALGASQPAYVASQNTFTHSYAQAGTYTITFTVTDNFGRATSASATVVVSGGTQTQGLSVYPSSGQAPLTVTITPSQTPGGYWAVQFGDGQSANLLQGSVTHTYTQPGTYTVVATSDLACLHSVPQCYTFAAQQLLGTATVTVTQGGPVVGAMTVTSPVQGQQVQNGTQLTINWGAPYLVSTGSYVLDLYTSAGSKVGTIAIQSATQSSGSYTWTVPRVPNIYFCTMQYPNGLCGQNLVGGSYYVRVSLVPGNGFDNQTPTAAANSGVFSVY